MAEESGGPIPKWRGLNISGDGDWICPGEPEYAIFDTYADKTGTYTDVIKLMPPEDGYSSGSIAMTYTILADSNYRLSMWVKAEKGGDDDVYIVFRQIWGNWEVIAGSSDGPAPFREGEWLYVATDSVNHPDGVSLEAGDKFGL